MRNDKPDRIPITVVMRSYNDAPILPRTLAALDAQRGVDVELAVFESASSDGSKAIFEKHGYGRIEHLEPGAYRSSKVLNRGADQAKTEVVVFLNSDAVLLGDEVLLQMAQRLLSSEDTAGVFVRQTVRPDANFMTRMEYEQAFDHRAGMGEAAQWMTLVCSAVRRSVWEKVRFDERLTYAEDAVWSAAVQGLGYQTVYLPGVAAEHSHNYTWSQRYRRAFGDASALAAMPDAKRARSWWSGMFLPWAKRSLKFSVWAARRWQPWRAVEVAVYYWPVVRGEWDGSRKGWQHFHGDGGEGDQPLAEG